MRYSLAGLLAAGLTAAFALADPSNAFLGRWDFDVTTPQGKHANWLSVAEQNGKLDVWFQPSGGHVYQVPDARIDGSRLTFTAAPASGSHPVTTWELTAQGGKLTGTEKRGTETTSLTGVRAPALHGSQHAAWSASIAESG